jgi:hypothetical protein
MKRSLMLVGLIALGAVAHAQVEVKDPWVRATVPAQKATGAFMELTAKDGAVLVGAASPIAGIVEIHEMAMEGGVMKMRAMPRLELPAGRTVQLKSGGYHVMLMELKRQVKKGDTVPITLKFEGKDGKPASVEVSAPVRELTSTEGASGHSMKH